MESAFLHYLNLWHPLGYFLIVVGMFFEGDAVLFIAGFLAHQGFFSLPKILAIAYSSTLLGDMLWLRLGEHLRRAAAGRLKRWVEKVAAPLDRQIARHLRRTTFITKFIYGMHHATIIRVGMLGVSRRAFVSADAVASAVWILLVGGLAYLASSSLPLVKHYVKFLEVALGVTLVVFLVVERLTAWFLRRSLSSNGEE